MELVRWKVWTAASVVSGWCFLNQWFSFEKRKKAMQRRSENFELQFLIPVNPEPEMNWQAVPIAKDVFHQAWSVTASRAWHIIKSGEVESLVTKERNMQLPAGVDGSNCWTWIRVVRMRCIGLIIAWINVNWNLNTGDWLLWPGTHMPGYGWSVI